MREGVFCNGKVTMPSLQFAGLESVKSTTRSSLGRVAPGAGNLCSHLTVSWAGGEDISSATLQALEEPGGFWAAFLVLCGQALQHWEGMS